MLHIHHHNGEVLLVNDFLLRDSTYIQDRCWNVEQPSAALDPEIQWLTSSPANHRLANFLKIKMLNGPAWHLHVAISASLCPIFCDAGTGFFFNIEKEIVKIGAISG